MWFLEISQLKLEYGSALRNVKDQSKKIKIKNRTLALWSGYRLKYLNQGVGETLGKA